MFKGKRVSPETQKMLLFLLVGIMALWGMYHYGTVERHWYHHAAWLPLFLGGGLRYLYTGINEWKWYDAVLGSGSLLVALIAIGELIDSVNR